MTATTHRRLPTTTRTRVRVGALTLLLAALCGAAPPPSPAVPPPDDTPRETVTIAGATFRLELAADPRTRERGLMGRREIAADGGMLFVFPAPGYRSFWMANCLVDIDLLYLDAAGTVVTVHRMKTEPPRGPRETKWSYERRLKSYRSGRMAQYVIELEAGTIQRLGIERGMKVKLDHERLTAIARANEPPIRRP